MREGGLDAPTRHPLDWQNPEFYDRTAIDAEMRRVFDICHGCRRCFNLCDSFPRLFDLIDTSESGELDTVESADFKPVVDACTLCDMCYLTKCPYVPPHEFNLDFPHLMLRYRAAEFQSGKVKRAENELTKTDRNGRAAAYVAPLVNWASQEGNSFTRPLMEAAANVHRDAALPRFTGRSFQLRAAEAKPPINPAAPAFGRKAVLYATCYANYNQPGIGVAAQAILAHNGIETAVCYPACCGMPRLEQGDLATVAQNAERVAAELSVWIAEGYDVIALVPSCALMLKFEWPLLLPDHEAVKTLAKSTYDVSEYIVDIAHKEGLAPGLTPLEGGIALHISCHSRAQNMGRKAEAMLRLIPETDLQVIERCSGHGGTFGIMKENFPVAMKVGRPVFRQMAASGKTYVASECPLAGLHLEQGIRREVQNPIYQQNLHPLEILAKSYQLL